MKAIITAKIKNSDNQNYIAEFSTSNQFFSVISSSPELADEFDLVRFSVQNLSPNTKYYVRIKNSNGITIDNYVGSFRTTSAGAHNFKFGFASCSWSNSEAASNQEIYDNIANKALNSQLDFFFNLGDMHYRNIAINDESLFQKAFDDVFAAPRQNNCWKNLSMSYMWDDHDYGPNDSDKNSPSRNAATAAFRRRVPSPTLANSSVNGAAYYSFIRGRVRFIVTDLRSEREPKGLFSSNDSRQKPFSDTQKNWFFDQMLLAKNSGQAIVWINTKPWISSIANEKDDWGGYHAARLEIANFIRNNGLRDSLVVLSGDMHALAYDDGTSINNYGNLRVCHAAPLDEQARTKGGPYLIGSIPPNSEAGYVTQYGIIEVTDSGTTNINIRFKGIVISKIDFSESTPIDVNFNLNVPLVSLSSSSSSSSSSSLVVSSSSSSSLVVSSSSSSSLVVSSSSSSSLVVSSSSSSSNNYPQCVIAPNYIDTNNPCYQNVILSDPYCCDVAWDGSCDSAYIACTETFLTSSLWIDPTLENIIFQPLSSSSSSSNGSPSEALSFNNMCLSKVAAGNQWSFMVNTSGFVTGWGNSTALGLLPITRQSFFNVSEPFFTDIAIGGGNNIGGVGFNIVCRRNGTISTWGETFRGNYIRELELSDNFGFTEVGATLNTAIAKRGQDIRFLGDVNYADTAYFTGENENFLSFSCGYFHILLETLSGTLLGYKDYNYFQAGTVPENLGVVNLYAAGYGYSLAVQKNGTITGWGVNGVVGDEVGFPPDWTVDTIRRSYGSGQLNIPTTVRRFASGTAWTGVDSHFAWPSGKIVKLLGGNGYAGAIVSEYDVDSEGEPVNPLINNLYIWGNNPYFSGVPSVIPDIIDGSIGRRSMLLINTGNNLVYYGFNSGWISDSFADLNDPKSIANADYDFNNISANLGGLCSKTFIEDTVVAAFNDFRVTGNYLFSLNLANVKELIAGDAPINDSGSYFWSQGGKSYPIAAGRISSPDIVSYAPFVTRSQLITNPSVQFSQMLQAGEQSTESVVGEGRRWLYPNFDIGMSNLIFHTSEDLFYKNAGNLSPILEGSSKFIDELKDFKKISTIQISSRAASATSLPANAAYSSLGWDCRFWDGWNVPGGGSRECEVDPPFERLKDGCLAMLAEDKIFQSYSAQMTPGSSDSVFVNTLEDWGKFFKGLIYESGITFDVCTAPFPPRRVLEMNFSSGSLVSGFNSTDYNARNFTSENFSSSLAYWFVKNPSAEINASNDSYSQVEYEEIKKYLDLALQSGMTMICTESCGGGSVESSYIFVGDILYPKFIDTNFSPRGTRFTFLENLRVNENVSPTSLSYTSHFITNRPDLLVYSRNNIGSITGTSINDLHGMPCIFEVSHHSAGTRVGSLTVGGLSNAGTSYEFFEGTDGSSDYYAAISPVLLGGIIRQAKGKNGVTYLLNGSRAPTYKNYTLSGKYLEKIGCTQEEVAVYITGLTQFTSSQIADSFVYWPNEYISEFPTSEISVINKKSTESATRSLTNAVYNNASRTNRGYGENFYIFSSKANTKTFFDILRRADMGDFREQSQSDLTRWGVMGIRPEKMPFTYLSLPQNDRNFQINTNLNLNKLLYQVVDKATISPNFPSPAAPAEKQRSKFFVKEGRNFQKETLHPRLLFPISVGPFSYTSVLLSGYLNSGSTFNNNYIIGLQLLDTFGNPTGKEMLIKDPDSQSWDSNYLEVPSGYIKSNMTNALIIKSGIQYASFRNAQNLDFELPLFRGFETSYYEYLHEGQTFWNLKDPIKVPLNYSVGLQIYSSHIGFREESIFYSGEALTNNTNYGYVLPKRYLSSNNLDYEYRFTPINFKILDGNLSYLSNPELENLRVKQFVVTCPIHDTINITGEI